MPNIDPWALLAPPDVTEEDLIRCRAIGDFSEVAFAWYQHVQRLCSFISVVEPASEEGQRLSRVHFGLLSGLLNRCARLMESVCVLTQEGTRSDAAAILDRCIFESAVKVSWLCAERANNAFETLLLDGLKTEAVFKTTVEGIVAERGGEALAIERRMLESVDHYVASAGATVVGIQASPKLLDMFSMLHRVEGREFAKVVYLGKWRIGSHHVHGTWPALKRDVLIEEGGWWHPHNDSAPPAQELYLSGALLMLTAAVRYVDFVCNEETKAAVNAIAEHARQAISGMFDEVCDGDFELVR